MAFSVDKNKGGSRFTTRQIGLTTKESNESRGVGAPNIFFYELEPGEVIDVILSDTHPNFETYEDIGKAKVRLLHSEIGKAEAVLSWVKPIEANIKSYPLIHEIVIVVKYFDDWYYNQRLNIFNNPNQNSYPGASLPDFTRKYTKENSARDYEEVLISGTSNKQNKPEDVKLGEIFKRNPNIKPLAFNEGDMIIEGRFGNTIKIGSNPETGNPNIKLRVGQPDELPDGFLQLIDEDFNNDKSSIWLTTDEKVPLIPSTLESKIHLQFYNDKPNEFIGNQIVCNSDRIVINAKTNEVMTFAKKAINFVTEGVVTIDSANDITINTATNLIVESPKVLLGSADADEPIVLGTTLKELLEEMIDLVLTHIHPTGTGPSGPMLPPEQNQIAQWKNKIKSALSTRNFSK